AKAMNNEFFKLEIGEIIDLQDNPYGEGNPLSPDDEFKLKVNWALENGHDYITGDTVTFDLPPQIALKAGGEGDLKAPNGDVVATYVVSIDGQVTLTFTDFVENHSEVNGWLGIRAQLDKDKVQDEEGKVVIDPIGEEGKQEIPIDSSAVNKTV